MIIPPSRGSVGDGGRLYAVLVAAIFLVTSACGREAAQSASPVDWAYTRAPASAEPTVAPGVYHIPDSRRSFTAEQINGDDPVDWIPEEHPPAPSVVYHQRPRGPIPCASCHYFNGKGFLEVPDLAGLPQAYIIQQVLEFRSGRRVSTQKGRVATALMIGVAKQVTDAELAEAAAYFSHLPRRPWIRTVETETVPVTKPDYFGWLDLVKNGGTEMIRGRIIELPEDWDRTWVEDPHSSVVAYVPAGSLSRGKKLARIGGAGAAPCTACHGPGLSGWGEAPPIAGRSPSYMARMLWDIKTGARTGPAVALMQPTVAALSGPEITDLAAYLASLPP